MEVTDVYIDMGPCCACGRRGAGVNNIVMLDEEGPMPGTGWGCFVCELPMNGAIAVVCDACLTTGREIVEVCLGVLSEQRRIERPCSPVPFAHRLERHPELAELEQIED
jgi:hypothetical protein